MGGAADIFLPYQRSWMADTARVRVWEKSRRIGASYCEAFLSVLEASKSREAGGQDTFYLSYNKEMTQTFIRDCAFWAKALDVLAHDMEELVLRDGEENPFNELIKEVRTGERKYSLHRTTLDDAIADGLFRTICKRAHPPREWTREAEDAWRAGIIEDYGDGADEELFCIPRRSAGAYLTTTMLEACMDAALPVVTWIAPAEDFVDWPLDVAETYTRGWIAENLAPLMGELPGDCAHFMGVDFGRSGDLSVFWPATEQRDLRLTPPFVLELRDCPHRTQQQILFAVIGSLPRFSGVSLDARGNGSALAEAARQKYGPERAREVMISEAWYRETMPLLKSGIEDKTLVLPRDAGVLSDFRSLRVVRGVARVPEQRTRDRTGGRHGDAVVACAMMLDARRELGSVEPWEYVGVRMPGLDLSGW